MAPRDLEALFSRYAAEGDVEALSQLFDLLAPALLRLARRLVGTADKAEDLVQEAFMVAMERPESFLETPNRTPFEPWLVGVLVNRARNQRRRDRRSPEPDRLVQREASRPDAELDRVEREAAVASAVRELPDDLRQAVEAKLAGREPNELARELGITAGAARARLHRALQRMRLMLPASLATPFALLFMHTTGLGAARGRVLRKARRLGATRGLGLFPGLAVGVTWMTRQTLAAAAVALIGLVWMGTRSAAAPERGQPIAQVTTRQPGAVGTTRTGAPRPALSLVQSAATGRAPAPAGAAALDASGSSALEGTVLGPGGEPVPGAWVEAWHVQRWSRDYRGNPDLSVQADAGGHFRLEGLRGDFIVGARTDLLACELGVCGELDPGVEVHGVVLELVPDLRMHGVVVDSRGQAVEGAEVAVGDPYNSRAATEHTGLFTCRALRGLAITDADGRFELTGLSELDPRLEVTRAGYMVYRGRADRPGREPFEPETLPNGAIRIQQPAEPGTVDPDQPVRVQLESGPVLAGIVLDRRGQPAVAARVKRSSGHKTFPDETLTDDEGRFVLRGFRQGEVVPAIVVQYPGHATQLVQPVTLESVDQVGPGGSRELRVQLDRERILAGVVVTPEGEPVPELELRLVGSHEIELDYTMGFSPTLEWFTGCDLQTTDAEGRFRFAQLNPGSYRIETSRLRRIETLPHPPEGPEPAPMSHLAKAGQEDLRLVLGETPGLVTIQGRVRDARSGAPIEGVTITPMVSVSRTETSGFGRYFESVDGQYSLAGLAPGSIELVYRAEGYAERRLPARKYRSGVHTQDIQLSPRRKLALSLFEPSGAPAAGRIRVRDADGQPIQVVRPAGPSVRSTADILHVGEPGEVLEGLPAEVITVELLDYDQSFDVDLTDPGGPAGHEARLPVGSFPVTELHLLVLTAADAAPGASRGGAHAELIELWRELRGDAPRVIAGMQGPPDPRGPRSLLASPVDLVVTDEQGRAWSTARLEPQELWFDITVTARAPTKQLALEFDGSLPHVALQVPTGVVQVHRVVDEELELLEEFELTAVGGEAWEVLSVPAN